MHDSVCEYIYEYEFMNIYIYYSQIIYAHAYTLHICMYTYMCMYAFKYT